MTLIVLSSVAAFAIFAATTITNAPYAGTVIEGDMGIFPGSAFTGFPPGLVTGDMYSAGNYAGIVKGDAQNAYEAAAEQPVDTILSDTDLGGLTLIPGVYKFDDTAALSQGELFLDAQEDPDAVWVFQIGSELNIADGTAMFFTGGLGNANNVFWQVGTSATLNKGIGFIGNILAFSSISLKSQASVEGRLVALNGAVTLIDNFVSFPVDASSSAPSSSPV
jgi:type VI secretion system secreted protein VgrG